MFARNVSALGVGFIFKGQIPAKRAVLCLDQYSGIAIYIQWLDSTDLPDDGQITSLAVLRLSSP